MASRLSSLVRTPRRRAAAVSVATAIALGSAVAAADSSSAALTFPNHGVWSCGDVWISWWTPNNHTVTIEPFAARGRAVMDLYVSGSIRRYYGPTVTNNAGQHNRSTATTAAGIGTYVAGYMQWEEAGMRGVLTKVYPAQTCF